MRIKIREQLSILVTFLALCCVGIPSLISWAQNYRFVVNLRTARLALVASLKADQLTQTFSIYLNSINSVASRLLIQHALAAFNNGNHTAQNLQNSITDVAVALATQPYLLQAVLYNVDLTQSVISVTSNRAIGINGITSEAGFYVNEGFQPPNGGYSWNGHNGFPDQLYPRASDPSQTDIDRLQIFTPATITQYNASFQGPVKVNETFYMASYTVPVYDQSSSKLTLLGFFTIVIDAQILLDVAFKRLGLDQTGTMLVVGPNNPTNLWSGEGLSDSTVDGNTAFRFVLPAYGKSNIFNLSATMSQWPTVLNMYHNGRNGNAMGELSVTDSINLRFSVGYVLPVVPYVDWGVIIAQSYQEVMSPVITLRNVLLATVFGTCGIVILLVWPLAHYFVRPITRLSHATQNSKPPPHHDSSNHSIHSLHSLRGSAHGQDGHTENLRASGGLEDPHGIFEDRKSRNLFKTVIMFLRFGTRSQARSSDTRSRQSAQDDSRNTFRIPSKVPERKHIIQDELTDLTHKFNRMTEELEQQYENLEDRVRERTVELEEQRKIAETANEAKSRFIANITHELRTPLNGILGMCTVCLADDDITRIKQSLGIVYKSGELLLHLLTDLLTFSRTQISGHAVALDLKKFRISDITSQVLAIFDKQAKDGKIALSVQTIPESSLQDMVLLGDSNRILQVIINLISNALKFTPEHGSVQLSITLGAEVKSTPKPVPSPKSSPSPNANSRASSRNRPQSMILSKGLSESLENSEQKTAITTAISSSPPSNLSESRKRSSVVSDTFAIDSKLYMFEFKVQDTGPGIPIDQQQKVFEPFVQGELGLNKKYGGTGLGLSICKQLATLMSGSIALESTEGVGTTFTLIIPLKHLKDGYTSSNISSREGSVSFDRTMSFERDQPESMTTYGTSTSNQEKALDPTATNAERLAAIPQPRLVGLSQPFFAPSQENLPSPRKNLLMVNGKITKPSGLKNLRVLVAEDNKINQEVVLRMLKLEQIENVTLAGDGVEAVDCIKEAIKADEAFHIVFMDVQMPNLDGLESTRIIRELGYSAPIVALSALTEESNIKECLESGMNYFLPKPIRRPALKQVLRTYCTPIVEDQPAEAAADDSPHNKDTNAIGSSSN